MDITEFMKAHKPLGRHSRLEPFRQQIAELKKQHYSHVQIVEWLQLNGVTISINGLALFLRNSNTIKLETDTKVTEAVDESVSTITTNDKSVDEYAGLTQRQRSEKIADEYIGKAEKNPLLERIKNRERLNRGGGQA
jgi:hypothetical protein